VAQGYPPRRFARLPARGRRGHSAEPGRPSHPDRRSRPDRASRLRLDGLDAFDDGLDEDLPPWAGLGIYPSGPGRKERTPPAPGRPISGDDGRPAGLASPDWAGPPDTDAARPREGGPDRSQRRRAAVRARRSRRRLLAGGGLIVIAIVVVLGVLGKLPWQGGSAQSPASGLVTTFLPGEFRSVPNACHAVSAATVGQYLPGKVSRVAQSLGSATQSQCTWTLDARPDFRVLTVSSQAYAPSLLASGNGSGTFGAIDAYRAHLQRLQDPPRSSKAPRAQLGAAVGLGRDAFTALQVFRVGGDTTDEVTVVVRDRNVLIIVTMQGQEHGGGFEPVPVATLRAAALAAAHEVLAGIR
jgi:hypothetical protein